MVLIPLFVALLSACSNSSGVIKVAPDTYTISTSASPARGGVPAAKRIAYEEAAEACAKDGREMLALNEKTTPPSVGDGMANAQLNFRCLSSDDPEFQRQSLENSPDLILEHRSK